MADKLATSKDKLKWAFFDFTPDEDLCAVSAEGVFYLVDPLTGDFKDKPVNLGLEFQQRNVVDGKMFEQTLILRNSVNQFYYISNVQYPVANAFEYVARLQDAQIADYIIIPKGTKGASALELLVPDYEGGFHVISENKEAQQIHLKSISDDEGSGKAFGKVHYMALNAKKDLLALYCDSESRGRIIVI